MLYHYLLIWNDQKELLRHRPLICHNQSNYLDRVSIQLYKYSVLFKKLTCKTGTRDLLYFVEKQTFKITFFLWLGKLYREKYGIGREGAWFMELHLSKWPKKEVIHWKIFSKVMSRRGLLGNEKCIFFCVVVYFN